MLKYILRRILIAIPIVLIISILTFALLQLAPYDAIDAITTPNMSAETIEAIKEENGLNDPAYVQYSLWLKNVATGDYGYSLITHDDIAESLSIRLVNTMKLVIPSFIIALLLAIVLGLIAGSNKGKKVDKFINGLSTVGISTPTFWLAMLLIYFFSYKLQLTPVSGMNTTGEEANFLDLLWHLILPITVLVIALLPEYIKFVRSSTISQLGEDYVTVQRVYGANKKSILFHHVLKNVLLPLITIASISLPMLITSAFVVETIFSWPGVGTYFLKSILALDYPIIMIVLLISSVLVILSNLIADILYGIVDKRIRD